MRTIDIHVMRAYRLLNDTPGNETERAQMVADACAELEQAAEMIMGDKTTAIGQPA